ncbi:hypothetical protein D7V86_05950 [bacterium D16-51]|nr:hypothetical protein D7V96_06725 [bacterium D16-59]RKI61323.1 hypothetical protein D7V86_05950 [bacterium D16-51]
MDENLNALKIKGSETILSLKDMATLIKIYDAIKKLNITLTGNVEIYTKNEGVLGTLGSVFDIIDNGICQEIKSMKEEDSINKVNYILDNISETPENRARQLLGIH